MFIRRVVACLSFIFLNFSVYRKRGCPMKRIKTPNSRNHIAHALILGIIAFAIAAPASLASQSLVGRITFLPMALLLLIFVILLGIAFDIIGVAAMSAGESPLHAMAAKGVFGAKQAVRLVRDAHRVASFCNDVVGDVTGTLSGAIGASILFHIYMFQTPRREVLATSIFTAAIASLIVTGKAYAKRFAIKRCISIMFWVGRIMAVAQTLRLHR